MTELDSFPVVRVSDDICETFAMHDSHLQVDVVPPSRARFHRDCTLNQSWKRVMEL